jgi:hypothetical protein
LLFDKVLRLIVAATAISIATGVTYLVEFVDGSRGPSTSLAG